MSEVVHCFGQEAALFAGFANSKDDVAISTGRGGEATRWSCSFVIQLSKKYYKIVQERGPGPEAHEGWITEQKSRFVLWAIRLLVA